MTDLRSVGIFPAHGNSDFKVGDNRTVCPKCEDRKNAIKNQSLNVRVNKDGSAVWFCHYSACGYTGTTNQRLRVAVSFDPVELSDDDYQWLLDRGLTRETCKRYGVTASIKDMPDLGRVPVIAFPYRWSRFDEPSAVKYRTHDKHFIQEKGGEQILFGMDSCNPGNSKELIITEGELDTLAIGQQGYPNVVSVPTSGTAKMDYLLTCYEFLKQFDSFVLAIDKDVVGDNLRGELGTRLGPSKCRFVDWPEGRKDANDVLRDDGGVRLMELIEEAPFFPVEGLHEASAFFADADTFYLVGHQSGLDIGYPSFKGKFSIRPGELTVVTGWPSSGKSEFVDQITVNMAMRHGWRWALASFENEPGEHMNKLIEKFSGYSVYRDTNRISRDHHNAAKHWINDHYTWIVKDLDQGMPTMEWLLDRMALAYSRYGVSGFVIDPWNQIGHPHGDISETEYTAIVLTRFRQFLRKTKTHGFLIAHPQKLMRLKDGKFPVPMLRDIAGSKNFEAITDNGLCVNRIFDCDKSEIHIQKVRSRATGKGGEFCTLNWDYMTGRFYENEPTKSAAADDYADLL